MNNDKKVIVQKHVYTVEHPLVTVACLSMLAGTIGSIGVELIYAAKSSKRGQQTKKRSKKNNTKTTKKS